jgi:hypothetical protein
LHSATGMKPRSKAASNMPHNVCAVCHRTGRLLGCDGECTRWFHLVCVGLSDDPDAEEEWRCNECANNEATCIVCREKGSWLAPTSEGGIRRCIIPACGNFAHTECMRNNAKAQTYPHDDEHFKCSQHQCDMCDEIAVGSQVLACATCSRGIHLTCLEDGHVRLTRKLQYCAQCRPKQEESELGKAAMEAAITLTEIEEKPVRPRKNERKVGPKPHVVRKSQLPAEDKSNKTYWITFRDEGELQYRHGEKIGLKTSTRGKLAKGRRSFASFKAAITKRGKPRKRRRRQDGDQDDENDQEGDQTDDGDTSETDDEYDGEYGTAMDGGEGENNEAVSSRLPPPPIPLPNHKASKRASKPRAAATRKSKLLSKIVDDAQDDGDTGDEIKQSDTDGDVSDVSSLNPTPKQRGRRKPQQHPSSSAYHNGHQQPITAYTIQHHHPAYAVAIDPSQISTAQLAYPQHAHALSHAEQATPIYATPIQHHPHPHMHVHPHQRLRPLQHHQQAPIPVRALTPNDNSGNNTSDNDDDMNE